MQIKRKKHGEVYTPAPLARRILREARIAGCEIPVLCDPACGDGAILAEAAKLLCTLPKAAARRALRSLAGFDIDEQALALCRENLDAAIRPVMGKWKCDWRLEKIDIISAKQIAPYRNSFTHVVGNPPYVRVQNLESQRRRMIRKNWKLGEGATDLFIIFFEAGLELLQPDGALSYITPSSWMKSRAGAPLRAALIAQHEIRKIVDFGDRQMFDGVTTYTAITAIRKRQSRATVIPVETPGKGRGAIRIRRTTGSLGAPWAILRRGEQRKFDRMQSGGVPLIEISNISVGIQTLADKIFILPKLPNGRGSELTYVLTPSEEIIPIETAITRPIIKASVARNGRDIRDRVIIYPYDAQGRAIPEAVLRKRVPKAYKWLLANKETLLNRDKGAFDPAKWFQFGRQVSITSGFGRKIITSGINRKPNFQLCKNPRTTFYSGYAVKPKHGISAEKLLRELNSEHMEFYIESTSRCLQHGWKSYAKSHIQNFPVVLSGVLE